MDRHPLGRLLEVGDLDGGCLKGQLTCELIGDSLELYGHGPLSLLDKGPL